eukprot:4002442-Alexandrium_andersonii.AAC.1
MFNTGAHAWGAIPCLVGRRLAWPCPCDDARGGGVARSGLPEGAASSSSSSPSSPQEISLADSSSSFLAALSLPSK